MAGAALALPLSIAIVGVATILAVASVFVVKRRNRLKQTQAAGPIETTPPKVKPADSNDCSSMSSSSGSQRSSSKVLPFVAKLTHFEETYPIPMYC